ncbi:MAG TPA: tyrosine-type recombinase/integrase [Thermodesulfobacteriota bacterium]|nr:tyrosine-type recombinase/integrase [Thermodesulfobacteriota bacterium]
MKALKTKYPGIYQIGENYYIDFYAGGKRHRKVVGPRLDLALEEKAKLRKKNKQGKYHIIERMEKTNFKELMGLYKSEGDNKAYILQFEKAYLEHFGNRKLASITRSDLFEFRDKVKGTLKQRGREAVTDSTVNRALAGLRRLFHFAVSKEYLEESPFPKDPKSGLFVSEKINRGKKRAFSIAEIIKVIESLPENPWYLRAMTINAYLTGMRAGELMNLKKVDVNLKDGEILLGRTKAGEPQTVEMQDELIGLYRGWLKKCPSSEYVFCKSDGGQLTHDDYYKAFKKALRAIGKDEKGYCFHTLRHSTGTQLHLKGVSPIDIKDQLRHSDIRVTTDFYVAGDPAHQKEQIEKLISNDLAGLLKQLVVSSETTVKKEVDFDTLQEVPPIASA